LNISGTQFRSHASSTVFTPDSKLPPMLRIRRMRPSDISFATRLTNVEGWGIPTRDFARILWLDKRGSFVASDGNRRVGLATTTHYGQRIAWIGNVVVRERHRKKHIGQQLVEHAVNYLSHSRVKHIALYCFSENVAFYRKLGFVEGPRFVRLRRESQRLHRNLAIEGPPQPPALSSVLAMDREGFGADRRRLINRLLSESFAWYLGYRSRSSASYVLVKIYDDMNEVGPWIALGLDTHELDSLLQRIINKSQQKPIEITCPLTNHQAINIMKRRGFHQINEGRLMFFKRVTRIGQSDAIVAYGFLDKG